MPRHPEKLVTVLGSAYFQPITDLVERLIQMKRARPTRVQSAYNESGYAAAGVLLLVAMFESYVSRVRFAQPKLVADATRIAPDVVLSVFPKLRHRKALEDVYVLRDLLMHGHLWEIEYEWGGPVPMVLKSATLHHAYGDKKFRRRVNSTTHRTKALSLSAFPSRVDRRDLLKVFETLWKTLLRFEAQDRFQCYVSHLHVRFKGKPVLFADLQGKIKSAL
ncbi:MAG: hypothetical protein EWM73_01299 [Nitrospira sp.]|nr:MAG: hypothetical protein EWM73_01299 [Nitrospira sp.]